MTETERRVFLCVFAGVAVIVIIAKKSAARHGGDENLDFCYSRNTIDFTAVSVTPKRSANAA